MLLLLSSYVEDLAAHIDKLSGKQTDEHIGESYSPLESLYSVVPILAQICNDGNASGNKSSASRDPQHSPRSQSRSPAGRSRTDHGQAPEDADVIDRLLLERTVDLINQVVQVNSSCDCPALHFVAAAEKCADVHADDGTGSTSAAHV